MRSDYGVKTPLAGTGSGFATLHTRYFVRFRFAAGNAAPRSGKMRLSFPWRTLMRLSPLLLVALFAPLGCNRSVQPASGGANPAGGPTVVKVARPAQKPVRWAIE